jgi:hypothetical protein
MGAGYKDGMKACEIFHVPYKKTFRWKWRHTDTNGRTLEESEQSYALYYECFSAAREAGYEPRRPVPATAE